MSAESDQEHFELQAAMVIDLYEQAWLDVDTAVEILAGASGRGSVECTLALAQEEKDRLWAAEWRPLKRGDDGTWTS